MLRHYMHTAVNMRCVHARSGWNTHHVFAHSDVRDMMLYLAIGEFVVRKDDVDMWR
jgi:hypothetical protein